MVWLHNVSDALIGLAYFAIPVVLIHFTRRRKDLPFSWMFWLFAAFILGCGSTHLMEVVTTYVPVYWLAGVIKLLTAVVSLATAGLLVPLIPRVLALRSPRELERELEAEKQIQRELERQAHTLREQALLLDLAHDSIFVRRLDDQITFWNQGAVERYGWTKDEAAGQVTHALLRTEFPEPLADIQAKLLHNDRWEGELTHTCQDGRRIIVASRWALQRDEKGNPLAVLEINSDVTARKHAEAELRRSNAELERRVAERTAALVEANQTLREEIAERKRLEEQLQQQATELEQRVEERTSKLQEANSALEAFGYSASHDLRTPLRNMQTLAQALQEDYANRLDAAGQDFCRRIIDAARKMDTLINDLLAYSRLSRTDLPLERVDLNGVLAEAQAPLTDLIRESQAEVVINRPLPAVLGHRPTLVQIVTNLLTNALKFVPPGTLPRVRVRAEEHGEWVRLWIEDNGIGIAPEHQQRIFQVFERLHGEESYPGTGIGLAIVKKGIERTGGRAGVESESGHGSRFWIELPRAKESA